MVVWGGLDQEGQGYFILQKRIKYSMLFPTIDLVEDRGVEMSEDVGPANTREASALGLFHDIRGAEATGGQAGTNRLTASRVSRPRPQSQSSLWGK